MKKNIEKRLKLITISFILIILLLVSTSIIIYSTENNKEEGIQEREEINTSKIITCISNEQKDDVYDTEIVQIENGILLARTNSKHWNHSTPNQVTCNYYTEQSTKLNNLTGVESHITCNDVEGSVETTYTISEINRDEVRLKQFDFMEKNNIFYEAGWLDYMKRSNYNCTSDQ